MHDFDYGMVGPVEIDFKRGSNRAQNTAHILGDFVDFICFERFLNGSLGFNLFQNG